ncbi:MAG: hypothetical protein K2X42_01450, partial [Burkholderiaceae bacterium]|nr:hypothetical protein [Burkholderiaceae bacterium]
MSKPIPAVPSGLPISEAMNRSSPLALLRRRLDESTRRHNIVRPCIPATLALHVVAGPVDEEGWTLIAANGS